MVNYRKLLLTLIAVVSFLAPILAYAYKFGFGVWESNEDWAHMGSAIGGLYAPLFALFTLLILVKQFLHQRDFGVYQQREASRKNVFEMVDRYSQKLDSMLTDDLKEKLRLLAELESYNTQVSSLKSDLLDVFTVWASLYATMGRCSELEPIMKVDLSAVPVLHLTFNVCLDLELADSKHFNKSGNNWSFYQHFSDL
ncbi:hypothetical protein [Paraglaciecola sp.]|uniref:hypothetical protein n=1 Tax=Paraglaciecola sp. TaxID=1920173 RepID=UPI0032666381